MKTEEDEAFDELERRQGGGFKAKQAMAADKLQEPPSEWASIKAILDEYGLQAIDFVADFKEALAQPTQELVALVIDGVLVKSELPKKYTGHLYTTPQQRPWVGLTEEEIEAIYLQHHNQYNECESPSWGYERAIEQALKEKNT